MMVKINNIKSIITWCETKKKIIKIDNNDILVEDGVIIDISNNIEYNDNIINANQNTLTPGFIDSHTHPIFAKNRAEEFQDRCLGKTYEEIASNGGGILSSIEQLRNMDEDELFRYCMKQMKYFIMNGTTTIEAKSGYGLNLKDEIKSLRVIKKINENSELDLVPTFMGAHAFPLEYLDKKDEYVDIICNQMIPEVAKEGLAEFCDVFCEEGYFSITQTRKIFKSALEFNLKLKIHADEFIDMGAASLAAEMGAVSADHLMQTGDKGINDLANSNTISTLLPGTTFFLGKQSYVSGRDLVDRGCEVAIASDFNPGSCTIQSIPNIMFLSMMYCGLTLEESFKACTYNAARAINREFDRGLIKRNYNADIIFWDINDYNEIPYWFGSSRISKVMKNGELLTI